MFLGNPKNYFTYILAKTFPVEPVLVNVFCFLNIVYVTGQE